MQYHHIEDYMQVVLLNQTTFSVDVPQSCGALQILWVVSALQHQVSIQVLNLYKPSQFKALMCRTGTSLDILNLNPLSNFRMHSFLWLTLLPLLQPFVCFVSRGLNCNRVSFCGVVILIFHACHLHHISGWRQCLN